MTVLSEDNYLAHYGILRKSGRYPWGSGDTQSQRNRSFLDTIDELRSQGMSDTDICKGLSTPDEKFTTTQLRAAKTIALTEQKQARIAMAQRLHDKGLSNGAIATRMGLPGESSVRSLLAPGAQDKVDVLKTTAQMLRDEVDKKSYIDIGAGVENHIGISATKLKTAVAVLKEEGYKVHYVKIPQLGTGLFTTTPVLSKPDVPYSEILKNRDNIKQIHQVTDHTEDGGRSYLGLVDPLSIPTSRLTVRYAKDGGSDADGVIYVRPGVQDLDLGSSRYAQVRIAVNGTHYIKGMAVYKDDLPKGSDLVFNTNKSDTGNPLDALKPLKDDKDNPFGAIVRQLPKLDGQGNPIKGSVRSAMNIVNEDADWEKWSKTLSSQFLSKQHPSLASAQLAMKYEEKKNTLDSIMKLTNPAVRKKLLESFADDADSSAVHLKAAALPRQANKVILPVNSLKENEVYAPTFRNGDRVALVRFPHGGTFEIPELTVNNRNAEGKTLLGPSAQHAIGIHSKVASRLSGADFDGDTVLVIPNNHGRVTSTPALEGLKGFDPKREFSLPEGVKFKGNTQQLMGNVSNLITDMTIKGAGPGELARAVRHSMVVIDAEKHDLDYKASSAANGIPALKQKYQGGANKGASTIVSRKKTETRVDERKQGYRIDPATGKRIYTPTGATFVGKTGETIVKKSKVRLLDEIDDANALSSGTKIEKIYADHSNSLKALANQARKEVVSTKNTPYSPSAKAAYSNEVASLNSKLNIALKNRPLERQAQLLANATVSAKKQANPDMDAIELKKIKSQALAESRTRMQAGKELIKITPEEWAAIQAGAISTSKLTHILNNTNIEDVKVLATPRTNTVMTSTKQARAQQMIDSGYTLAEVADQLGVALGTLKSSIARTTS